ncbi:MAG: NUDIX domain-containing protein [Dysgonomonas sp.]|nr:NUDIX domain-containing protein [Dysgonomonas sp.]
MRKEKQSANVLQYSADVFHPGTSVDCVIFGFHEGTLKILLNKFSYYNKWMIPGGFVHKDENVDDAAYRLLTLRTGLSDIYLRQFYLFGDKDRTNIEENEDMLIRWGITDSEERKKHWLVQRFVSVGYYALVEYSKVKIETNDDEEIAWFDLDEIPVLYTDHNKIIEKALATIRMQLLILPFGYELLPEKFTMTELRIIYETILRQKLDRRNFQRKMLGTGLIHKLDEVSKKWGVKSSALFSFDKEKYYNAVENGFMSFDQD